MERIFLVLTSTATCIFKYPFLIFTFHFSLIHCPLLVTFMPVLSMAMTMYSSLNCLFLLSTSFIFISSRFTLFYLLYSVVRNRRYFSIGMSLCYSFGLLVW